MLVAAELGGTAAHQAAHAADAARLGALMDDQAADVALIARADRHEAVTAAGGSLSKAQTPTKSELAQADKARDAAAVTAAATDGAPSDSQASGVMPLVTGLGGVKTGPLVERVDGAASGDSGKPVVDESKDPA